MSNRDEFQKPWKQADNLEYAKGIILTGYKTDGYFTADSIVARIPKNARILDFGCGVGRNLVGLVRSGQFNLHAYDFPNMVEMAHQYMGTLTEVVEFYTPPLHSIPGHYDWIITSLVLQHIAEDELREILVFLRSKLHHWGKLWVNSRGYMDDRHLAIWPIIEEYFEFESEINPEPTDRHQSTVCWPKK